MLIFRRRYFLFALLLFCIEVAIALFLHDRFVRPYVGDFLVVIMLYCFAKSFLKISALPVATAVLLFAYAIEVSQYFHLANRISFQNHNIVRIVLGSSFEWSDMLAYTVGIAFVLLIEKKFRFEPVAQS